MILDALRSKLRTLDGVSREFPVTHLKVLQHRVSVKISTGHEPFTFPCVGVRVASFTGSKTIKVCKIHFN